MRSDRQTVLLAERRDGRDDRLAALAKLEASLAILRGERRHCADELRDLLDELGGLVEPGRIDLRSLLVTRSGFT
jgi:hypothetical protein